MSGSKGSWGKTQEAMENQGSSTFLRLEGDGDKAVVAFCGAPFHRDICYNEKTKTYEAWDDTAKAAGRKKSSRYAMNVFAVSIKSVETNEMKVIDMNFNTMQSVIALKDKYGLAKCLFEVTRHGAKGDTKTQYQNPTGCGYLADRASRLRQSGPEGPGQLDRGHRCAHQPRRGDRKGRFGRVSRDRRPQVQGRQEDEGDERRCCGSCGPRGFCGPAGFPDAARFTVER